MRLSRGILITAASTAAMASMTVLASPAKGCDSSCPSPVVVADAASHMLDLANQERAAAGVPALTMRADVTSVAVAHSQAMAGDGNLRHNDDYFTSASHNALNAKLLGENVAQNPDVDDAHHRLMNSEGHRANLLDPHFSVVGIAVVRDGDGEYWITQDFLEPRPAAVAVAPAPKPAAHPAPAARPAPAPVAPAPAPVVVAAPAPAPEATADTVLAAASKPVAVQLAAARDPLPQQKNLLLLGGLACMIAIGLAGTAVGVRRSMTI
jgi:uncharacterized protein YkwD